MTENGDDGLSLDEIKKVDDIVEAIGLMSKHGIFLDDLEDVEEMKVRMLLHYTSLTEPRRLEQMYLRINNLGIRDRERREELLKMVEQVRDVFPPEDPGRHHHRLSTALVQDLLLQDGSSENIREDCNLRTKSLREKECVILVSGESSAGKSSLLNLLLGESILPSHMLPCTSCITIIRYSIRRCAKILFKDGTIETIDQLDLEGLQRLQSRAYFSKDASQADVYEKRKKAHDISEIQIYLPLTMLESGLVLVDTPGVGENEYLQEYLMEYIHSHQILGFMYVIMTDNALGIAEDRLVNLMSLIIKSQRNSTDIVKFNPKAALFVCNRWDMVPDKDKKEVRANTLKQLSKCWPDFDPSSTVFFSTAVAQREFSLNPSYITEDFVALLYGLNKLVEVSLDKRIRASYKWLGVVINRSVYYMYTVVTRMEMSERDRQKRTSDIKQKLKTLRTKSDDVVRGLKEEVDNVVMDLSSQVRSYLETPEAKLKLTKGWGKKEGELPDMEMASGTWDWVKRHIEAAFEDRLTDLLEEWDKEQQYIPELQTRLAREAKLNLCHLENELGDIERSAMNKAISRTSSIANLTSMCHSLEDFKEAGLVESDVPAKVIHRISKLLTKKIRKKHDDKKLKAYEANPERIAQEKAEKLLKEMIKSKENRLETFVREMMQKPLNYINQLENKLPSFVSSNMTLLEKLESEIMQDKKSIDHYVQMMSKVERLRSTLARYGEGNMAINDFKENEIEVLNYDYRTSQASKRKFVKKNSVLDLMTKFSSEEGSDVSKLPHGLWHSVHRGRITKGSETHYVMVKLYTSKANIDSIDQEVAKLRCLLVSDVCVAELKGVFQYKETPIPALIFAGDLVSVADYMLDHFQIDEKKLLLETLSALQYIHSKGLVHMDLRKDSLTVERSTGDVKITGQCLPRAIKLLPVDLDNLASDRVYIAPEVLAGETYMSFSDMYSFALLALEVKDRYFQAFNVERKLSLREFSQIYAVSVLKSSVENSSFSPIVKKRLLQCLDRNIGVRLNASDLSNELRGVQRSSIKRTLAPKHLWQRKR